MPTPTLPPYLGDWDTLLKALLNDPFLGSPNGGRPHKVSNEELIAAPVHGDAMPAMAAAQPAVSYLVSLIALTQAATGEAAALEKGAHAAIDRFIDDYCGNGSGPGPVPPRRWMLVATELAAFGASLAEGPLRQQTVEVAAKMFQRGVGAGE